MSIIEKEVLEFISETLKISKDKIGVNDMLMDIGAITSTGLLDLINFVGDKYKIKIKNSDVTIQNFGSVAAIGKFVEKKI